MMTKRTLVWTASAALLGAGVMASGLAADSARRARKRSTASVRSRPLAAQVSPVVAKDIPQPVAVENPIPEPRPMVVQPAKTTPTRFRELYQTVAVQMTKARLPVPELRLRQFRWLDDPRFRLDGWHGAIQTVEAAENGYLVTVAVRPLVTSPLGASTTVVKSVSEQYLVSARGEVAFVQSLSGVDDAPPDIITD